MFVSLIRAGGSTHLVLLFFPLLLTVPIVAESISAAPPPIEWTHTYGGDIGDYGVEIIQTPDSAFAFLMRTMSYAIGNDDFMLLRLDDTGGFVWQKTYGGPEGVGPQDVLWTGDGYLLSGYDSNLGNDSSAIVLRTDTAGVTQWMISPGFGHGSEIQEISLVGDSGWLAAGRTERPGDANYYPYVVRIEPGGDTSWSYASPANPSHKGLFKSLVDLGDGTYMACGYRFATSILTLPRMARIDPELGVLWEQDACSSNLVVNCAMYLDSTQTVVVGGYISGGSGPLPGFLMGVDLAGDSTWSLEFNESESAVVTGLTPCHDGGFVACVTVGSGSPTPHYAVDLYKYDVDRQLEWSLDLDSNFIELSAKSIHQTLEGGFIIGAYSDDSDADIDVDAYAAKIASPFPYLTSFTADGENPSLHLLSSTPVLSWDSFDPEEIGQVAYQFQIDADTSWSAPPIWDSGPVSSTDTSTDYAGAELEVGQMYFLRQRISNGLKWSRWYQTSIRRNTPPAPPTLQGPSALDIVPTAQPTLWMQSGEDPDGDTIRYEIQVFQDTEMVAGTSFATRMPDSTEWTVDVVLQENTLHWWRARSFDGYEYSGWSDSAYFWVDAISEAPGGAVCVIPPSPPDSVTASLSPAFHWTHSPDPDPVDNLHYRLLLSTDSMFQQIFVFDTISDTSFQLGFSLDKFRRYWWKVYAVDSDGNETVSANTNVFYAGGVWCCTGSTGNVNTDPFDNVNLTDITVLINYLFVTFNPLTCYGEANTNGDRHCDINLSDVTVLVNHLFVTFQPVAGCGDFSVCGQD